MKQDQSDWCRWCQPSKLGSGGKEEDLPTKKERKEKAWLQKQAS